MVAQIHSFFLYSSTLWIRQETLQRFRIIGLHPIDASRLTNDQERAHSFNHHTTVLRMSDHSLSKMPSVPVRYGSRKDSQIPRDRPGGFRDLKITHIIIVCIISKALSCLPPILNHRTKSSRRVKHLVVQTLLQGIFGREGGQSCSLHLILVANAFTPVFSVPIKGSSVQ